MANKIQFKDGKWIIPQDPIIGFIEGDGIGIDISSPTRNVINSAVQIAYNNKRNIHWTEILAGEKSFKKNENYLPQSSLNTIKDLKIVLKGPLTTPIGGGFRSLNVAIRQKLDLYSCIRPVKYYSGLPSPVKEPEKLDIVIFRENTEDVYAGIEFASDTKEAQLLIETLKGLGKFVRPHSGIGIKPVSPFASKRLVRSAMKYSIANKRKSLTIVHKGNIMKYTEGSFKDWAYELIREEFSEHVIFEKDIKNKLPEDKILIKDRIADSIFQQLLLRPNEYDVLATLNLNGDYLSDAAAAQIGGLGIAPGSNIGDGVAVFEATHGTAPKYKGMDKVNPSSLILSGVLMLDFMNWKEASKLISDALQETFLQKKVTYDLARQLNNPKLLKCSEFALAVIENMKKTTKND